MWSEVAVASLKHRWDNKMRLPDENGGKDRRATFDDVGDHNVTTKTILGARVRQQVGVPHGAHHRRILEGEKKRGMRGPATRSAFWGCRACKAARDEATKEAREARSAFPNAAMCRIINLAEDGSGARHSADALFITAKAAVKLHPSNCRQVIAIS